MSRWQELLVNGWEYNFIGTLQPDTPFSNPTNVDQITNPSIDGANNAQYSNTCVQQTDGTSLMPNPARTGFVFCSNPAWRARASNTLQAIQLTSPVLRNPWRAQWDMALNKRFNFTERINAQFRFEAFNVFNTPILRAPNNSTSSTNFGFVTANQANFPWQVQLEFKLNF